MYIILAYYVVLLYLHPIFLHATVIAPPSWVENGYRTYQKERRFFSINNTQAFSSHIPLMGDPANRTWDVWSSIHSIFIDTLPETNSSPLKMDGWNTILSYWDGQFSGANC